jgi:hypothetical protein
MAAISIITPVHEFGFDERVHHRVDGHFVIGSVRDENVISTLRNKSNHMDTSWNITVKEGPANNCKKPMKQQRPEKQRDDMTKANGYFKTKNMIFIKPTIEHQSRK